MLSTRARLQVIAFVVVSFIAVAFVGANYAGLPRLFGRDGYVVKLRLAEGAGLFTNGEVTYRGVAVGRVGDLRLADDGVEADLLIEDSAPPIPANLRAVVANRSAVGEQYVDLQPRTDGGPFLADGSVIPRESTELPLPVTTLLGNLSALTSSVPQDSLRIVVDELYLALHGAGPNLQLLLDSSSSLTETAAAHLPQTTTLIDDGSIVLRTQLESSQAWRSFSRDARLFAAELARADGDLRRLIGVAPEAANELSSLLVDADPELSVLIANLLTTANVFEVRTAGMEHLFAVLPQAVAATSTAISDDGGHLSQALTFFDPLPCVTGYEGTTHRSSSDVSPVPLNIQTACTLPPGSPSAVRGSQNAPRESVPPAATPRDFAAVPAGLSGLPAVSTTLEEMLWLNR